MLPLGIICFALAATAVVLSVKLYLIKRSAKEIEAQLDEKLRDSTNTLIDISSGDRDMRSLADSLNAQLRILRERRRIYEQGDTELKQAVTNISHDLRTPLTAICGYLDLMEQQNGCQDKYIEILRNRTEVMKQLTDELFRYSVIMAEEGGIQLSPCCINDVLEESAAAFYAVLTENSIEPEIEITERKVIRRLDRRSLARVFSNLLNNAVKYSDGDLKIALSDSGEIIFENSAADLSEVEVGRLFDRFYTVEAARKSTGLGLAIAKTLVEQMNGAIYAEYKNGRLGIHIAFDEK